jgi:large subunit ribosomal protein L7/L12
LAELINEKMGLKISDAERERMARGGGGGGGGGGNKAEDGEEGAAAAEEKTAFDLKLTGFDAKAKIKVIKEIRAITSLGLKEAKELVEGAPSIVKKDIKKEEAEELKAKLEGLGATVEIA